MKQSRSPIDDLTHGSFQEVLDDPRHRSATPCAGSCSAAARSPGTRWPSATSARRPVADRARRAALPVADRAAARRARRATRTPVSWSGCRRSPRTWAPWNVRREPDVADQGAGLRPAPRRPRRVRQPGHRLEGDPRPGARRPHGRDVRRAVVLGVAPELAPLVAAFASRRPARAPRAAAGSRSRGRYAESAIAERPGSNVTGSVLPLSTRPARARVHGREPLHALRACMSGPRSCRLGVCPWHRG